MRPHKVEFYFDYNSPYSYIASLQVEELCERQGATLEWHPMVLGAVFQVMGHTPSFQNETRRKYLMEDLRNLAEVYGLPYRERTQFIFHPILSMRATVQVPQGAQRGKAVHALFRGAFAEDKDLGKPEVVTDLLNQAGLDGQALVAGANQQAVKDTLKANTDRAVARGVFGAPTLFIDDSRMFWGHDRLHVVEHFLQQP
ncbi:MAG TPA: 2-hydroxychromene-2-carboxylate isomerase [bacterium]|nr:2-hydroxychromene-2-carboxylate isomerase [bacterium]